MVSYLREKGHRVFAYLEDLFGAARQAPNSFEGVCRTRALGRYIARLFRRLRLWLHLRKVEFSRKQRLEILGIEVDTCRRLFLLGTEKMAKIERAARLLICKASSSRRLISERDIRRFAALGNSVSPAILDARLRLWELFDAISTARRPG